MWIERQGGVCMTARACACVCVCFVTFESIEILVESVYLVFTRMPGEFTTSGITFPRQNTAERNVPLLQDSTRDIEWKSLASL